MNQKIRSQYTYEFEISSLFRNLQQVKNIHMSWENENVLYFIIHCNVECWKYEDASGMEYLHAKKWNYKYVKVTHDLTSFTLFFIVMFQKPMVKFWRCIWNEKLTF